MNDNFHDKQLKCLDGFFTLAVSVIMAMALLVLIYYGYFAITFPVSLIFLLFCIVIPSGFFINRLNEAKVVEFFGSYIGTIIRPGFFCTIPFTQRRQISLKVENTTTKKIRVNDINGNSGEIAATVVWKVAKPAQACFNVSDHEEFVFAQSESAIRELATLYNRNDNEDSTIKENYIKKNSKNSVLHNPEKLSSKLKIMLQNKLDFAGIQVVEANISYYGEITHPMLNKQQTKAPSAIQGRAIKNALGIIDGVLLHFEEVRKIKLTDDQKAKLINNLLVALVSRQATITLE